MELVGVAGHDVDVRDPDAELLRRHLRQDGEVPLPLRADAGRDGDLAAGLHLHARAFERSDAGALDVRHDADAERPPGGARRRLLLGQEPVPADALERLAQRRLVVSAVVGERREVLIDDVVNVRELVRPQEIAPPDFDPIEPQLPGGEVEQALDDEDAVLASGAAVGGHDRLVGEHRGELAVVRRHAVGTEQRALAVERHGEAVRVVRAGIVQEAIPKPEDGAILAQRDLRVVDLQALLRRRDEVLAAVAHPLDRPQQPQREPGDQHFFGVEHHDLRAEAAADERRHHPHLVL